MKINNKLLYIGGAIFVMFFIKKDALILNSSLYINIIIYLLALVISILIFIFRKIEIIDKAISSFIGSIILFMGIKIILIFSIQKMAKEEILIAKCPINNYISGRLGRIQFIFKGEKHSIGYSNKKEIDRIDLINNYEIILLYKISILDTYVIQSYEIIDKNKKRVKCSHQEKRF